MYYHSVRVNTMLKDVLEFESFNPDLQNVLPQCPCPKCITTVSVSILCLKMCLSLNHLILISKMYCHNVNVSTLKDVLEFESFNPDLQNVLPRSQC